MTNSMRRRAFLAGTAAAAGLALAPTVAAATPRLRFTLPAPTGRLGVGMRRMHLVQHDRPDPWHPAHDRELMISIWYPAHDDPRCAKVSYLDPLVARHYTANGVIGLPPERIDWAGARTTARLGAPSRGRGYPVLLYSPGAGNTRAFGTVLVADLVSRGYVVVTVDHTYETPIEFPGGRLVEAGLPSDPPDLEAAKELFMAAREADLLHVIARLDELSHPVMDLSRLGIFGHSAGGLDAVRVMRAEPRVLAGANFDGFFEFGKNQPELGVDRPMLLMGAASHPQQPPLFGATRTHLSDPLWGEFWEGSTGWKLDLAVPAGRHYTFTDAQWFLPQLAALDVDVSGLIGTVPAKRVVRAHRDYVAALFDLHLKGIPQPLLDGPVPWYPDIEFVPGKRTAG